MNNDQSIRMMDNVMALYELGLKAINQQDNTNIPIGEFVGMVKQSFRAIPCPISITYVFRGAETVKTVEIMRDGTIALRNLSTSEE